LGGGNGNGGVGVHRLDLAVDPLNHGFQFTLLIVEDLDELLGTDIVGKGPQTLARTAGQQYEIHSLSPYTKTQRAASVVECGPLWVYRSARIGLFRKSS